MTRHARLALVASSLVAGVLIAGGLIPSSLGQGPIRRDGPLVHAVGFALLVMPLVVTWPRQWWLFVIGAVLFGIAIEGLQTFTDRATELGDVIANSVGAVIGAGLALCLKTWLTQRTAPDIPASRPKRR